MHSTQTTMKQGRSTVELDLSLSDPEDVVQVIEALGYRAQSLAAHQ